MAIVFQRPKALLDVPTHYCPGCTHGIIHRLVAECIARPSASRPSDAPLWHIIISAVI